VHAHATSDTHTGICIRTLGQGRRLKILAIAGQAMQVPMWSLSRLSGHAYHAYDFHLPQQLRPLHAGTLRQLYVPVHGSCHSTHPCVAKAGTQIHGGCRDTELIT
jgi:hypothetical protein